MNETLFIGLQNFKHIINERNEAILIITRYFVYLKKRKYKKVANNSFRFCYNNNYNLDHKFMEVFS